MGTFQKTKDQKQIKKYLLLTGIGILVVLLAVMPMLASRNAEADESRASILSATVEYKDIDTQIIGGGQLSSEASLNVRIPEHVKLTQYLAGNGDTVKKGDAIARVDKVSVMTAITEVQETLDYLAGEIAAASDEAASTGVRALAGGTVKVLYAKEGESVQDVMLDHGALAILSLDDTMAVKIVKETNLEVGDTVCVTLSDGTQVDGRVKTNLEGVLTVTMDDDDYSVGAKVTVGTKSGEELGTGELYIFSPWSATAYSGMISDVLVNEHDTVAIGRVLFSLEDTGKTARFQRLIDQRQEYEELMQELFTMYRTETITAPCDGIVTGVDKDGAYLLSDDGEGWFVGLLSYFGPEEDGFAAYAAAVTEVTGSGTALRINPRAMYIEDLAEVSGISVDMSAMTESWNCPGEIPVYIQDENGLLHPAAAAGAGDILLAVGDEEQVRWFVKLDENNHAAQAARTENKPGEIFAFRLSDTDAPERNCTAEETCSADSHNEGCPMRSTPVNNPNNDITFLREEDGAGDTGGNRPQSCTGEADCTFEPHLDSCRARCDLSENCSATNHKDGCASQITTDPEQPPVQITTTQLPNGTVGIGYNATLQASASGTWSVTGLPAGLTLDASAGTITGTPAEAGAYSVAVTFADGENRTATATFLLTIAAATSDEPEADPVVRITTAALENGVVGASYTCSMLVSGSMAGTWRAENLPGGLVINEQTGVISGTPAYEGTFTVTVTYTDTATGNSDTKEYTLTIVTAETKTYTGYVAQVAEIQDGWAKVKQTLYSYAIADLSDLPLVSVSATDLTVEKEYTSDLIKTSELAVGDTVLLVVDNEGTVQLVSKEAVQESQGTSGQLPGTNAGGGMAGGIAGGMGQVQTFETYSLDKLTVASVTSQEHMTVSVTIDELDITRIYVGQEAVVSVDALGGEQFEAEITKVSNSGENKGGNSKFTVEVTLGKSGDMLPGMYSSAFITLTTSENIPCVPVAALGKDGVDSILYTSYDAETGTLGDPVVVRIGVSDGENVQILDGFAAGETCYYAYYDTYIGSDAPRQQRNQFNLGRMLGGR